MTCPQLLEWEMEGHISKATGCANGGCLSSLSCLLSPGSLGPYLHRLSSGLQMVELEVSTMLSGFQPSCL